MTRYKRHFEKPAVELEQIRIGLVTIVESESSGLKAVRINDRKNGFTVGLPAGKTASDVPLVVRKDIKKAAGGYRVEYRYMGGMGADHIRMGWKRGY